VVHRKADYMNTKLKKEDLVPAQLAAYNQDYWPVTEIYRMDDDDERLMFERAWLQVANTRSLAVELPGNRMEIWRKREELRGTLK